MTEFDRWTLAVDALCSAHLACVWDDLCGDMPPLRTAFEAGESPMAFVRWWAEKFDLQWREARGTHG